MRAASCLAVGLRAGIGGGEGVEFHASLVNPPDRRERSEVEGIAVAVENLRHKRDVGKPGAVAVAEGAGARVAGEQRLERAEPRLDPMVEPCRHGGLVMPERSG